MHLRRTSSGALLASLVSTGPLERLPADDPLFGSWAAVRWQYASRRDPSRVADVVTDLGGSVTLSLTDGTYVLTWGLGGQGHQSGGGGAAIVEGGWLDLTPVGAPTERLAFRLTGDTLALSSETSDWDFGAGEEPAEFVGVLVRL